MGIYADLFSSSWYVLILCAVTAYLLGSINTAVIVTKVVTKGKGDIKKMGSGNAGFTNVLRSVGKVPAVITIISDALKCVIAVLLAAFFMSFVSASSEIIHLEYVNFAKYVAGIFCILGHSFPLYFHFKGGKGVVTAAALIATEDWRVFIAIIATFLIVFVITKIISISSIIAAALYAPFTFAVLYIFDYLNGSFSIEYVIVSTVSALIIGIFVIVKHRANIVRLIHGEEKKITAKK